MSYINKPGKTTAWRQHVLNNLVADVIGYEKIETSLSLARHHDRINLTGLLAKLITWAKKSHQNPEQKDHFRNLALRYLVNKKEVKVGSKKIKVLDKLFNDLGQRYQDRPGGYSRIIKLNYRSGDNNQRVIFSLV